jgi:hypothetical protein
MCILCQPGIASRVFTFMEKPSRIMEGALRLQDLLPSQWDQRTESSSSKNLFVANCIVSTAEAMALAHRAGVGIHTV